MFSDAKLPSNEALVMRSTLDERNLGEFVQSCMRDRNEREPNCVSRGFARFLWSSESDGEDGEFEVTKSGDFISTEDRSRYSWNQVQQQIFYVGNRDIVRTFYLYFFFFKFTSQKHTQLHRYTSQFHLNLFQIVKFL